MMTNFNKMILLTIMRKINKVFRATQNERIHTERFFKSTQVYNYIKLN